MRYQMCLVAWNDDVIRFNALYLSVLMCTSYCLALDNGIW